MHSESDNTGASVKADFDLSAGDVLRIGTEFQRYRLDDYWKPSGGGMWPGTFQNINDGERGRAAVFGEWESKLDSQPMVRIAIRTMSFTTSCR